MEQITQLKHTQVHLEAPYYTYGTLGAETQEVWILCHGISQRAKYFLRKWDGFPMQSHYLIAPQGLSRYYLSNQYEKVGASWMTREYRELEIENQGKYLDSIIHRELGDKAWEKFNLVLMGFSQGVAAICRWAISREIPFQKLILWAGTFPHEVNKDLTYFLPDTSEVWAVVGDQDPFIQAELLKKERIRLENMFGKYLHLHTFRGAHEVKREVLTQLFLKNS